MKLQKPNNVFTIIAIVLVALSMLGSIIPIISGVSFWLVLAGFVLLFIGSLFPSPNASHNDVIKNVSGITEIRRPNKFGQIAISLVFSVIGYVLGSAILPMLSFTSWERHAASKQASYLGSLNSAYSETQVMGGILGGILFFVLGMIIMHFLINTNKQAS